VAGVVREALEEVRQQGVRAKLLVPRLVYPVAEQIYEDFFASVRAGLVIEQSHQGQLYRVIRMFVDVPKGVHAFARSGSNPFTPGEIAERLRDLAVAAQRAQLPELEPHHD
jgi:2-oxoglutarate/2-oxoacid ferredoxin oxidoreductase subunit alpha